MLLKTQKKIAYGVVAALAISGVAYELSGIFDHAAQPRIAQQQPEMPTPIATPVAPVQVPSRDTEGEAVAKLEQNDIRGLTAKMGYTTAQPRGLMGHSCVANGNTDGLGSDGMQTAISYDVELNGQQGHLCVDHTPNGNGGTHANVSAFVADAQAPKPRTEDPVATLERGDISGLTNQMGYSSAEPRQIGHSCVANGDTDGLGSDGMQTAISYSVVLNGRQGHLCVDHTPKSGGGTHADVSAFVADAQQAPAQAGSLRPEDADAIAKLEKGDVGGLTRQLGYAVSGRHGAFGHGCAADGNTDGLGSDGMQTAISYDVTRNGRPGLVCVDHVPSGGKTHADVKPFVPN